MWEAGLWPPPLQQRRALTPPPSLCRGICLPAPLGSSGQLPVTAAAAGVGGPVLPHRRVGPLGMLPQAMLSPGQPKGAWGALPGAMRGSHLSQWPMPTALPVCVPSSSSSTPCINATDPQQHIWPHSPQSAAQHRLRSQTPPPLLQRCQSCRTSRDSPRIHTPRACDQSPVPRTPTSTSQAQEVIAIDIDEVLCRFAEAFEAWRTGRPIGTRDVGDCHFAASMEDAAQARGAFVASEAFAQIPPVPGALEALRRLKALGLRPECVTTRSELLRGPTERYLERFFPGLISRVHFVLVRQKGLICKNIGARLLIDDQLQNVADAIACGVHAIIFDLDRKYVWNHSNDEHLQKHAGRIHTWAQVVDWIVQVLWPPGSPTTPRRVTPRAAITASPSTPVLLQAPAVREEASSPSCAAVARAEAAELRAQLALAGAQLAERDAMVAALVQVAAHRGTDADAAAVSRAPAALGLVGGDNCSARSLSDTSTTAASVWASSVLDQKPELALCWEQVQRSCRTGNNDVQTPRSAAPPAMSRSGVADLSEAHGVRLGVYSMDPHVICRAGAQGSCAGQGTLSHRSPGVKANCAAYAEELLVASPTDEVAESDVHWAVAAPGTLTRRSSASVAGATPRGRRPPSPPGPDSGMPPQVPSRTPHPIPGANTAKPKQRDECGAGCIVRRGSQRCPTPRQAGAADAAGRDDDEPWLPGAEESADGGRQTPRGGAGQRRRPRRPSSSGGASAASGSSAAASGSGRAAAPCWGGALENVRHHVCQLEEQLAALELKSSREHGCLR